MKHPDDPTRPHFYVAQIELDDGTGWTSLHVTAEDADAKLRAWAFECGVDDIENDHQVRSWGVSCLPVHNIGE